MLRRGQLAPEFALRDQDNQLVSLAELLSNGPLVLFFYPGDFTPLCTREACMLRDVHSELQQLGIRVVGISPDKPEKHDAFRTKYALPYTLLADPEKDIAYLYGAEGPMGIGIRRATYLIGQDGYIEDALVADLRISRHEAFVQKVIATAHAASPASA